MSADRNEESMMEEVLRGLPTRERADPGAEERVFAAALTAFEALPEPRGARGWSSALAAGLAIAALGTLFWLQVGSVSEVAYVAQVEYASGAYRVGDSAAHGEASEDGLRVAAGSTLSTGPDSRMRVAVGDGAALRIDSGASVRILDAERIELLSGRVYVDAWAHDVPLVILSGGVQIRRVGTQFTVSREGQELSVAVREGEVRLASPDQTVPVRAMEGSGELVRMVDGRLTERSEIDSFDPEHWGWVQLAHGGFQADGKSLYDYLRWVERETGRKLVLGARTERLARGETDLNWGAAPVTADRLYDYLSSASVPMTELSGSSPWELRIGVLE